MLDKECFDPAERIRPMFEEALRTQTFGLRIVCWTFFVIPTVPTEFGPRPGFAIYYQAKGLLLDGSDARAQLTAVTTPFATQNDVNEAVAEGAQQLREYMAADQIQNNGKGSS
jgi:hypothetical protein